MPGTEARQRLPLPCNFECVMDGFLVLSTHRGFPSLRSVTAEAIRQTILLGREGEINVGFGQILFRKLHCIAPLGYIFDFLTLIDLMNQIGRMVH